MSEGQRVFLLWAWAVLGLVWLGLMVLVAWICAQWRTERLRMRAKERELEKTMTCAIDGCGKPVKVQGNGSFWEYSFCSMECASKYD
jgi:membrane protein implicated in regulation of membrane protease activity